MRILITGHCGFIGQVAWKYFKSLDFEVFGIDDLSRRTSNYIQDNNSIIADITKINEIDLLQKKFDWVIHLAAQVSVNEGKLNPKRDFESNARGTFEVVQWAKRNEAGLIYASSNKVFGDLDGIFTPILDNQPLKPSTNYGVSKAAGSMYVMDYELGGPYIKVVFTESRKVGDLNQGWIGWLRQCVQQRHPIVCFGDGSQKRDLLNVQDLVFLYNQIMLGKIERGSYVVGGGPENSYSFQEVVNKLKGTIDKYDVWRDHDQKYFVSANEGLQRQGWKPRKKFTEFLEENLES